MAVGLFVAMFVAFLLQIFTRYVLNHPLGWTLEACVILYIWIVFWTSAFLLRERDHVAFTMLCDAVAPGARVLKTDCFDEALGTPHPAAAIAARAWRPVAVDVGLTIAAGAARNGGAGIAVADVRRLPYPDGAIDAVFSNSTLDHFADAGEIGKALAEIRRVLRPGGRLLLTLDNPRHPLVALRNALPRRATEAAGITHFYVGATLAMSAARRLLARLGFEPRGAGYLMHAPRWWSIRRLARVERDKPERIPFLIKRLLAAERAARWPSAPLTGHFLWIDAAIPDRRRR